jgi:hypothetical protein
MYGTRTPVALCHYAKSLIDARQLRRFRPCEILARHLGVRNGKVKFGSGTGIELPIDVSLTSIHRDTG